MQRILLFSVVFVPLLVSLPRAWAGFEIGNGGDAVECRGDSLIPAGTYALDFLLSGSAARANTLVPAQDVASSLLRIERLLAQKAPSLAADFAEFSKNALNETDWSRRHVWEPVTGTLRDVRDEGDLQALLASCASEGRATLRQAVVRVRSKFSGAVPGQRVFAFDPVVLAALEATSPLQVSFLVVHEWLWDYSHKVERNRRVAGYLHTKAFDEHSAEEVTSTLVGMGFPVPGDVGLGALGTPCDQVRAASLCLNERSE